MHDRHLAGSAAGHPLSHPLILRTTVRCLEVSQRFQVNDDCQMSLDLEHAGCPEVGEELMAEAHDEEPDVPSHLRPGEEEAPGEEEEGGVEEVVNVSEPFQVLLCSWDPGQILLQ